MKPKEWIEGLEDDSIWKCYALIKKELKKRKLIRTGNITGERGEKLAIKFYNESSRESNLQEAPPGTQNVDALSRKGERYSRKSTGAFYGFNLPGSKDKEIQKFEYVILVLINELFEPVKIMELTWNMFLKHKRWHKTQGAWNLYLTKNLENDTRLIYGLK